MGRRPFFAPKYNTMSFANVWPTYQDFENDYNDLIIGFAANPIKIANLKTIYYLLYSKYGNNPIANFDLNQFKMKIFATIYAHGPLWERKVEIQATLRSLTEEELLRGAKQIYNHALNPSTAPSTAQLDELEYINDQSVTNHKKAKMEAYSILWSILHSDMTEEFLRKFKNCFSFFVDTEALIPFYIDEDYEII